MIRSLSLDVLITVTVLSIVVSYIITAADMVFICDIRIADFCINVCNGVYYSILVVWLLSTNARIQSSLFRVTLTCLLVILQLILAVIAHLESTENREQKTLVKFCYDERGKPVVVLSYAYGFVLMLLAVILLYASIYRNRSYYSRTEKIAFFCLTFLALAIAITNGVAMFYLLWANEVNDCGIHANFVVVMALFPAILSIVCCGYSRMISSYAIHNSTEGTFVY